MKRIFTGCLCALMIAAYPTAFASGNTVMDSSERTIINVDAQNFQTVIITKDTTALDALSGTDVVYVDQNDSALGAGIDFAMSKSADTGSYIISMGNELGDIKTMSFIIGADVSAEDVTLDFVESETVTENKSRVGFSVVNAPVCNKMLKVKLDDGTDKKYLAYDFSQLCDTTISGDGLMTFGLQMNNIETEYANEEGISVLLSPDAFVK